MNRRMKIALLSLIAVITMVPLAQASSNPARIPGRWVTDQVVDVLGVADEEMDMIYPQGWPRYYGWEMYIYDAFAQFQNVFHITFALRGWISYDSDDSGGLLGPMLDEAIRETGYQYQVTTYNGYVIDLLFVMTAQWNANPQGFSPPERSALIIWYAPDYPRTHVVMHELTHQYGIIEGTCTDPVGSCVMRIPGLFQYWNKGWGSYCYTWINNHRTRFNRTYWVDG